MKKTDNPARIRGIKSKLTLMIVLFTALLLAVIWLMCVVMLDHFYKQVKTAEITGLAKTVETITGSDREELASSLNELCADVGANAAVIGFDQTGRETFSVVSAAPMSILSNPKTVSSLIKRAEDDGGEATYIVDPVPDGRTPPGRDFNISNQNMLYVHIIKKDGGTAAILISVTLASVDTTRTTITQILLLVSAVFVLLAAALGVILSGNLSTPLEKLNETAKDIGTPKYKKLTVHPGCRETAELNETLSRASEELQEVNVLRRELIANISHDLRTPLTMISGYGEMMRDIPGENNKENIQIIIEEADRLTRLVNDVLSLSKLENGMERLEFSEFNITASLRSLTDRYSALRAADGYTLEFIYDREYFIRADQLKLSQVFYNLINNAITYTGDSHHVVIKQSETEHDGEKYLHIDVIDDGEGIPPENLPYIWDRYYKVKRPHKREAVGAGLGLSIVKNLVSLHGGRYGVESELNKGSDFWIELPLSGGPVGNDPGDTP